MFTMLTLSKMLVLCANSEHLSLFLSCYIVTFCFLLRELWSECNSSSNKAGARPPIKLRILCMHGFRQNAPGFRRTASLAKKLKGIVELIFVDALHELPLIYLPVFSELECSDESSLSSQQFLPSTETCRGKLARLIAPDCKGRSVTDWKKPDSPFDPLRYQQQTVGFNVSPSYLKTVFSQDGPFDGILGFS